MILNLLFTDRRYIHLDAYIFGTLIWQFFDVQMHLNHAQIAEEMKEVNKHWNRQTKKQENNFHHNKRGRHTMKIATNSNLLQEYSTVYDDERVNAKTKKK